MDYNKMLRKKIVKIYYLSRKKRFTAKVKRFLNR